MAEKLLNLPHVGSSVQKVRSESVSQYVGTFLALHSAALQFRFHDPVNHAAGYTFSFLS